MKKLDSLSQNIIITIIILFVIQSLLFLIIRMIVENIPFLVVVLYYPVSLGFHLFILFGLFVLKRYFVLESTGVQLTRINLANFITLFRLSAIPSIFFLLMVIHIQTIKWILIVYISFIFITDFVDGFLARSLNQITKIGKYLDSSGDYLILFFSSFLYLYYSLIPVWLFIAVVVRLLTISITINVLYYIKREVVYVISFLGKVSIFALMLLFSLKLLPLFGINNTVFNFILSLCEYFTGGILIISFVERIYLICKALSSTDAKKEKKDI